MICRSTLPREKADVLEEEMRNRTPKNTGVWGQTSAERSIEITLGKTYYQQGLAATGKDYLSELNRKDGQR